ncbi:hypothetical protein [Rhizobacter sp. P5_C2]
MNKNKSHVKVAPIVATVAIAMMLSYFIFQQSHEKESLPAAALPAKSTPSDRALPGATPVERSLPPASQAEAIPKPQDRPPVSFASANDIWAYANSALKSNNESQVYEGYWAARECTGFGRAWLDYSSFASGGKSNIQGTLTQARQIAIQALQRRCNGFILAGNAESKKLVSALDSRAVALGGSLADSSRRADKNFDDDSILSTLIFSQSPTAIEEGLLALSKYWDKASAGSANGERIKILDAASLAAICDLGKDCSNDSYYTQLLCAMGGECSSDFWQKWSDGLDASQVAQARIYKQKIIEAVHGRNLAALKNIQ